jgi:O-acetyl-ADP-ribose deacetylase (regulator of RNase III)
MEFTVVQGDIAQQEADALVNAANTGLEMGSGVAGALRERGGEELNEAAVGQGPIELGEVAVTDGYGLDAQFVIHAAAMPAGGKATADSIRAATRNALLAADKHACSSIVLPALGGGVAGFDLEDGARLIAEEIREFDPEHV